jgi:hypothetical protein
MRASTFVSLLLALIALPGLAAAAERACEQSERTVTLSPKGRWEASVQHQVCETDAGGVAAAVTVYVGEAGAALQGGRVVATAVPRTRDEWPRAVWREDSLLEIWVPNFAQVLETKAAYRDVAVVLKHCADDPDARARVAQHQVQLQQWMASVSQWAELRNRDPAAAGARPPRPEEPRETSRPCRDGDIPP